MNERMQLFIEDLPTDKQAIYKFVAEEVEKHCDSFADFFERGALVGCNILNYYSECRDWINTDPESFREILEDDICSGEHIVDILPEWSAWHGWNDDSNACMAAWAVFEHVAAVLADMED